MQVLLHPSDQPIFRLRGSFAQCRIEVRINDVPVIRDTGGQSHSFDLPLNEWLFQGINTVQVHLRPLEDGAAFGKQTALDLKWMHKLAREPVRNQVVLGEMTWRPDPPPTHDHAGHSHAAPSHAEDDFVDDEDSMPLLALPGQTEDLTCAFRAPTALPDKSILIVSQLPLPPPWPVCPWIRGSLLAENGGTHHAVGGMVRSLHHTLGFGGWEEHFKTRRAAIQAAYHLGGDEMHEALGFPPLLKSPAWQLQPLPETPLKLGLAAGGKLARLLDPATAETPLILANAKTQVTASIDAWWMFAEEREEWVLVR